MSLASLNAIVPSTAAWTPASKSGLVFWFKADSLALNDGDPISTWTDSSGNLGQNATQAGTLRPLYKTNIQNSKPAVRYDGVDDYFTLSSAIPTSWATNAPLFVVCAFNATDKGVGSQFHLLCCIATATTDGANKRPFAFSLVEGNATFGDLWSCFPAAASTTGVETTPGQLTGSAMYVSSYYNGSGVSTAANYDMRKSNTSGTEVASGTGSTTSTNSYLGAWTGTGTPSLYLKGDMFEIFGYNTAPSAGDYTNIAAYMLSKWNIS